MNKNIVNIKGSPYGLTFYFDTVQAGFSQLLEVLEEKLIASGDFFINADYLIDQPSRFTSEELAKIAKILKKHHLQPGRLAPHILKTDETAEVVYQTEGGNSLLVTKTVRSGQKLTVRGNAVVMGDINPGGEIVATGNVVVMGLCRGVLHAGAEGDKNSYIIVHDMHAQQLRIADKVVTVSAEVGMSPLKLAVIQDGNIVLTDYVSSQFKENMVIGEA